MVSLQFTGRVQPGSTLVVSRFGYSKPFQPKSIKVVKGNNKGLLIVALAVNGKKKLDSPISVVTLGSFLGQLAARRLEPVPATSEIKVQFQNVTNQGIDFCIEIWGELLG